jgi:tetratricopeptide (TPR) repeat protein
MKFPLDTRVLKFGLAASAVAYAVQLFVSGHTGSGVGMVLLAIVIGLTGLRSLRMVMVALRIQQQKMDKARTMLASINPQHLWPKNRGQYWFLKGNLLLESSLSEAEKAFRQALEVGLKRDEEKAAVMLNLAAIQSTKRRTKEAKALLVQAKRFDKKGMLKADIRTIEQAINNPQTVMRRR